MSVGLISLFDDIAAIAKVAAASLDHVASQAAKAGMNAAGVVIDDEANECSLKAISNGSRTGRSVHKSPPGNALRV